MTNDGINWAPQPPKRSVQVFSVAPGQTVRVISAGPVCGVLTHWDGEKSIPCKCQVQTTGRICDVQAPTWKGYMPCYWPNGRRVIVEVTLGAINHTPALMKEEVTGMWVKFSRKGPKKNGAVYAEVLEDLRKALNLVPYDPRPRLLEMWGLVRPSEQNGDQGGDQDDAPKGGPPL